MIPDRPTITKVVLKKKKEKVMTKYVPDLNPAKYI